MNGFSDVVTEIPKYYYRNKTSFAYDDDDDHDDYDDDGFV